MVSAERGQHRIRPEEVEKGDADQKPRDHIPVNIPVLEKELLDEAPREGRFLDFLKAQPSRDWLHKFGFSGRFAPFTFLRRNSSQSEGPPRPDPLPVASWRRRFRVSFARRFSWSSLVSSGKKWIKNPKNMAFLVWLVAVVASLLVMLLVASGLLNGALPRSSQRKEWQEVNAQILNALFTIMCLYQHPKLIHHLVLLLRWNSKDAAEVRLVYSKKGILRPHERAHMLFVVVLLHITCMAQYTLCALYWGFSRTDRPDMVENLAVGVGTILPIVAGVYTLYGPLGRKVNPHSDEESQNPAAAVVDEAQAQGLASNRRVVVTRPQWVGGLFDCWDDLTVAYLSFFCTFCVFGWNMERLGFGNMYVHIATFVLLVVSPLWVFGVAALKIDNSGVREAVWVSGVALCALGVLYGGFWRIRMRKRFGLPGNGLCCGRPGVTDCFQWLLCWPCSLAQEVRTGDLYDVEMGSSCRKVSPEGEAEEVVVVELVPLAGGSGPLLVVPLGREATVRSLSCPPKIAAMRTAKVADVATSPPVPPQMQLQLDENKRTEEG
uniref:Protein PLANT CADMIUM RESISTANCE 8 n=1 Tax=Anthurium amnicola TaxID=1678845 RepID=A0A1D1YZR6_9ARAE